MPASINSAQLTIDVYTQNLEHSMIAITQRCEEALQNSTNKKCTRSLDASGGRENPECKVIIATSATIRQALTPPHRPRTLPRPLCRPCRNKLLSTRSARHGIFYCLPTNVWTVTPWVPHWDLRTYSLSFKKKSVFFHRSQSLTIFILFQASKRSAQTLWCSWIRRSTS